MLNVKYYFNLIFLYFTSYMPFYAENPSCLEPSKEALSVLIGDNFFDKYVKDCFGICWGEW